MTSKHNMIIRVILTIILLSQVWGHSHWSVALCLTLIFVGLEVKFLKETNDN